MTIIYTDVELQAPDEEKKITKTLRVRPGTSRGITKFSEHEAD